jgi:hypothetical protein
MAIKSTTVVPKHGVNQLGKVLVDPKKNDHNMAEKAESGTHVKKESPKCGKGDELVLRPQPSKRINVKGKIAHIRLAKPKLRLD